MCYSYKKIFFWCLLHWSSFLYSDFNLRILMPVLFQHVDTQTPDIIACSSTEYNTSWMSLYTSVTVRIQISSLRMIAHLYQGRNNLQLQRCWSASNCIVNCWQILAVLLREYFPNTVIKRKRNEMKNSSQTKNSFHFVTFIHSMQNYIYYDWLIWMKYFSHCILNYVYPGW